MQVKKIIASILAVGGLLGGSFLLSQPLDTIQGLGGKIALTPEKTPLGRLLLPARASSYGSVQLSPSFTATYTGVTGFYTPPASANNIFWDMTGSSTKTIYITQVSISRQATGSGADQYELDKLTSANSGGTSSTVTEVPVDSNFSTSGASSRSYTVIPSSSGGVAGPVAAGITSQGQVASNLVIYQANNFEDAITLRGTAQGIQLKALTTLAGSIQVTVKYLAQ